MKLPEELLEYDGALVRDLLKLGPRHRLTRDREETDEVWYYLMTYSFVDPTGYDSYAGNGGNALRSSYTVSPSGRALLGYLNEQLAG